MADVKAEAIRAVFLEEGHLTSEVLAKVIAKTRGPGSIRTARDYAAVLHDSTLTAWSDGIETGLAIAIRDIAGGRRLLEWIRAEILENDPDAREATETTVSHFLQALER